MKKLLNKVLVVGLFMQALIMASELGAKIAPVVQSDFIQELDENDSILNFDCPFYFFKTCGKHPYMMKYNKATNTLTSVSFGHLNKQTGDISYVNFKASLIESLVPIRLIETYFDANVKIDKKFAGWREPLGEAIAKTLKFIDFLPEHAYSGVPFVDEYNSQLPAKWVFGNTKEYQAFINYLKTTFVENNVTPLEKKPVLLVEIADNKVDLKELDLSFIAEYYRIVSVGDNVVKAFYSQCQEAFFRVQDFAGDSKISGQSTGEIIFGTFEKPMNEFKTKEFTALIAGSIAAYLLINPIKSSIRDYFAPIKNLSDEEKAKSSKKIQEMDDFKRKTIFPTLDTFVKVGGVALVTVIIYNVINKHLLTEKTEGKAKNKTKADAQLEAIVAEADRVVAAQA